MTSSASSELVAESASKGVAAYLRGNEELPVAACVNAIHTTLCAPELPFMPPESSWPGTKTLMNRLEDLVGSAGYKEGAQLCQRAAWKAFMNLEGRGSISHEEVAASFGAELSWEVTERKCIGIARDEVAHRTHRSLKEQLDVENDLRQRVKGVGRRFGAQLISGKPLAEVRAPNRQTLVETVENILHQSLPVVGMSVSNEE
jgi:hypothetical protein